MRSSTMAEQQPAKSSPSLTDDRRKALNLAITQIEKTCGKGSIMRMGADSPQVRVAGISTGAVNLDAAIGIGGIPRGQVTDIFGPESSGDSLPGLQARLMSQALRKLAGAINRSRTSVIFINQLREKIGVMFGNPETTSGGRALKFYASVRLDMRRIAPVKDREVVIGNHVRVKVVKNKVAPPFRQAEFDIMFDEGISHESLLVDIAAEAGIIEKSGAWYSYGKERIGQGRENAKLYLKDHPDMSAEVEARVKLHLGVSSVEPGGGGAVADEESAASEE